MSVKYELAVVSPVAAAACRADWSVTCVGVIDGRVHVPTPMSVLSLFSTSFSDINLGKSCVSCVVR